MENLIAANAQPYIIYADDDLDDQAFLTEMLRRVNHNVPVHCFLNGLELVQFLENLPTDALLPCCIILDLNMPVWDGMHTLTVLKNHRSYQSIPTFIFSTSTSDRDAQLALSIGAVDYIAKPYAQHELQTICQDFADYAAFKQSRKKPQFTGNPQEHDTASRDL